MVGLPAPRGGAARPRGGTAVRGWTLPRLL